MRYLKSIRRRALAAAAWMLPALACAQGFPDKPIKVVVPFAAGGGTDSIARDMARTLSDRLGQPVVVENHGGGGGSIGANLVAHAAPDGYTLLFATSTFATNAAAQATQMYDVDKSFAPVALIGRGPLLVVASKDLGVTSVAEPRSLAGRRPDAVNFCSAGAGRSNHLSGELISEKAGGPRTQG